MFNIVLKRSLSFYLAVLFFGLTQVGQQSAAENPATFTLFQNVRMQVPKEHRPYVPNSGRLSIRFDAMSARDATDDMLVTVIRDDGQKEEFSPSEDRLVTLDNVKPGPLVVVASSRTAHGTMFVNLVREPNDAQQPQAADAVAQPKAPEVDALGKGFEAPDEQPNAPMRMTMLALRAKHLRPIIADLDDIEDDDSPIDFADELEDGDEFNFQVSLSPDGTLNGRVISVMKGVGVDGTKVVLFRAGQPIDETRCDQNGMFGFSAVQSGVHGIIASGPAGYAAFAFQSIAAGALVMENSRGERFTQQVQPAGAPADRLPVVLCPPPFVPEIVESITDYYPSLQKDKGVPAAPPGEPLALPVGGSMIPAPPATGVGGVGGAAGGAGGIGPLVGILAGGAIIAAVDRKDRQPFIVSTASPVNP